MVGGPARARERYERREWRQACDELLAMRAELDAADLERLAVSAFLVGRNDASDQAWAAAYRRHREDGEVEGASRCVFWLAFRLVNDRQWHQANAWVARLERLGGAAPDDTPLQGRIDYLTGLRAALEGDLASALGDLERAADIATRRGDDELGALARLSLGRVHIFLGRITSGLRLLDDAMLAVSSEPVSLIAIGDSYCTAIEACHDLFDVRRGHAWTDDLNRWCDEQPDLVPFAGVCQVHRAEFLQLRGAWVEAKTQADLAKERLSEPFRQLAYGAAVYQQGELHRLRGEFDRAETCYRDASAAGRDPQPGMALLRLRQGRTEDAAQAIGRAVSEAGGPLQRAPLLAAQVEILLAADRVVDAEVPAAELAEVAALLTSPLLAAAADRATGSVRLARNEARHALADLRRASDGFRALEIPYEVATTARLIGTARASLGDREGAALELDTARATFARLGAQPDLSPISGHEPTGLTARELEVLRLVAQGSTNRSIGTTLGVSQRTVDRHVSNILVKLGVSSRAAATARAYETSLI